MHCYEYPRPAVTVDMVVFSMRADDLVVLLIRRKHEPFAGAWALPGGFVDQNESLARAAARELREETGLTRVRCEQLGAYGDPRRDPRGHTVSVAYLTFVNAESVRIAAGDDAAEVAWFPFADLERAAVANKVQSARSSKAKPRTQAGQAGGATAERSPARSKRAPLELAFDHGTILQDARARLEHHLQGDISALPFALVPENFTLSQLQRVHEVIRGRTLDKRNFRAKLLASGRIEPVARLLAGRHRPAQLYRWADRS